MNYRKKIIDLAKKQLGTCEPSGDDKYLKWYNRECEANLPMNASWCACFVTWVIRNAKVPVDVFGNFAQCSVALSWAKKKKIWYSKTSGYIPKPGDFVLFDWGGDRRPDHVGLVEFATTKTLTTIEGNTKGGHSTDGVRRKIYAINSRAIMGYIAPNYEGVCDDIVSNFGESKKELISDMQEMINERFGFRIAVDGIWGKNSKRATIKALQKSLNKNYETRLIIDGIWGPKTEMACREFYYGCAGSIVELIQIMLNVKQEKVSVDGIYGKNTKRAVQRFQERQDLSCDGIVGRNTMRDLMK